MPDDPNETAAKLVREATETEPESGEELLGSEELKRQYREAKERLKKEEN